MKKLLSITKLVFCLTLSVGCFSNPKPPANTETKTTTSTAGSTTGSQTQSSGTAGQDGGFTKDTMNEVDKNKAIQHAAPDQAKIDSLKNAKTKNKQKP